MELIQLAGDTWYLAGQELIPLYRLDSRRCILLDSGLGAEREELAAALDRAGLTPLGVFGSHVHRDHSVNHFWLRERYGTRVCLPRWEAALCGSPMMLQTVYGVFPGSLLRDLYGSAVGQTDQEAGPEDGTVDFCGVPLQVIHTPGHTPDHICTVTPDGVCYLADALLTGAVLEGARLPYHSNHMVARQSMEKLRAQDRYKTYLCAHRGTFDRLAPVIDGNLALLDRCAAAIRDLIQGEMGEEEISAAVIRRAKLLTSSTDKALRYRRNARAVLDYLVDTRQAELVTRQGICRYRLVQT